MGATRTIALDKAAWPYWWIKWANVILLSNFVLLPLHVLSSLLKRDWETAVAASVALALFAFPGWIAWQNIDVVSSIGYTD